MSFFSDMFERANIQHIREYIASGQELCETDPATYQQRVQNADDLALEAIRANCPDKEAYERMEATILQAFSMYEDVYMEIGLQAGLLLAAQVYANIKGA